MTHKTSTFARFICLSLVLAGLVPDSAWAQDAVVPGSFRIKDIKSSGDACKPGSVSVNISDDKEAFTVSFSDFVAEKGPNSVGDKRRACRLVFDTEQDANWEYGVLAMNMRGFVALDAGVTGRQEIQFGTKGGERDAAKEFIGPIEADYIHSQQLPLNSVRWTGCKPHAAERVREFAVKATAVLRGGGRNGAGLLTVDTIDGQLEQVYELLWRRCGDKKEKFVTTCQVSGAGGNSISVKGMGRDEQRAVAQAYKHLNQRCDLIKDRFGRCDASVAQCSTTKF